jgi:hypothetical protein
MTAHQREEGKEDTANVLGIAKDTMTLGRTLVKAGAEIALFPDKRRTEYSELIDRAFALLVDQVEAVRRALREIDDECNAGDQEGVVEHLKRLESSSEWEHMERDMRMCAQLRLLHSRMHGFFGEHADKITGVNRKELLNLINRMIHGGEGRMADYITQNLSGIAGKRKLIEQGILSLKQLRSELVVPINKLTKARKALIELELQARNAVLASKMTR